MCHLLLCIITLTFSETYSHISMHRIAAFGYMHDTVKDWGGVAQTCKRFVIIYKHSYRDIFLPGNRYLVLQLH